jgi:hypothetical protein
MPSQLIESLGFKQYADLIHSARHSILYCSPNIHDEIAHALAEAAKEQVDVCVILDPSEDNYRNGFGTIKSIDILQKAGVRIYEVAQNLISFLLTDETGYLIFPQSRHFVEDGEGPNALRIDRQLQELLLFHFRPNEDFGPVLPNPPQTESSDLHTPLPVKPLDQERLERIQDALEKNPPLDPDLKRKLTVYTSKLNFVDIRFTGANLNSKKIKVPSKVLPYKDEKLRKALEAHMRLFTDLKKKSEYQAFKELNDNLTSIRKKYLSHLPKRKKNIVRVDKKSGLENELTALKGKIAEANTALLKLITREILNAKTLLRKNFIQFMTEFPPVSDMPLFENDPDLRQEQLEDEANRLVHSIKFPNPKTVVDGLDLTWHFYEPTWSDFQDQNFLNELIQSRAIEKADANEIRSLQDAFGTKKHSNTKIQDR